MEEGSLLQESLQHMQRQRDGELEEDNMQDAVQLDVYDLQPESDRIAQLQCLAQLASAFNNHIQSSDYLWYTGYPPVFGICVSEGVPHLRAACQYGDNVKDEWTAIRLMMELSRLHPNVAINCWDLDVGPILLIEGSDGLPDWLSEGDVDNVRYICWIVEGSITLIGPTSTGYSLKEALDCLQSKSMLLTPLAMQTQISKTVNRDVPYQRTALIVPRPVARLLQHAPELANAAAVAFTKSHDVTFSPHEDWVWTTCTMARTNYAMLRTSKHSNKNLSAELKRYQRACSNEATPHVRHALEMGMNLTAGLDLLLSKTVESSQTLSPMECRILQFWTRVDIMCGGDGDWLRQAWQMGPNNSPYNMNYIMQCPVYEFEHEYPYPISRPGVVSMGEVIRIELKRKPPKDERFIMPRPEEVDGEEWMHRGDAELEEAMAKHDISMQQEQMLGESEAEKEQGLDSMLGSFQKFMSGKSEVEGIAHDIVEMDASPGPDEPVRINPRVFLNLLHQVLKTPPEDVAHTLSGASKDPYFAEEDYALMEPAESSSEDETGAQDMEDMEMLMNEMDTELRGTAASRTLDNETGEETVTDRALAEDVHLVSNLMQSLGASEGAPGPVFNILKEMGVQPPKLRQDELDETDEE